MNRFFQLNTAGLLLLLILFTSCEQAAETVPVDISEKPPVLLISIDGLMPEYLERNDTPHFDRIAENGVKAESLKPVFPTKTFPTHYSMVTGLYPEEHGIISNSFYDFELDAQFSYGPPEEGPEDNLWWGGEPIWVTVEKQSGRSATMFWVGSDSEISGVRPTRYLDYDGSLPNNARVDSVVSWLDPEGEVQADFATLYHSDVDSYGHRYGPNSPEVDQQVLEADRWLGYLFDRLKEAGLIDSIHLILVSDHGMAELSEERVIFLDELIDLDRVDMIDWSPVAMIRPEEGAVQEIYEELKSKEEHYTVYLREELPDRYHFRNHYRIPEILMIADLGYTITSRPFFQERGLIAGNHGYDPELPEMHAVFLASGPQILSNERVGTLDSIHLYELMCHLLGLEPSPNSGSLDSVRHILR